MIRPITILVSGVFLSSVLWTPMAQADVQRGLLISVGQATQSIGNMQSELQGKGYSNLNIMSDEKATTWSLGYRHAISRRWSADIQYLQQGKVSPKLDATLPLGKTTQQAAQDATDAMPERGQGISAVGLYHLPLSGGLSLQAGLGAFAWQSQRTVSAGTANHTRKTNGVSTVLQLGVGALLTKGVQLEAHVQRVLMPDEPVDRLGLGVVVLF